MPEGKFALTIQSIQIGFIFFAPLLQSVRIMAMKGWFIPSAVGKIQLIVFLGTILVILMPLASSLAFSHNNDINNKRLLQASSIPKQISPQEAAVLCDLLAQRSCLPEFPICPPFIYIYFSSRFPFD